VISTVVKIKLKYSMKWFQIAGHVIAATKLLLFNLSTNESVLVSVNMDNKLQLKL